MASLKFLGISGSLRGASSNSGLLRAAGTRLPAGVTLDIASLADIPFYNADITGKPAAVQRVLAQMAAADALVFACPEYNYSLAPAVTPTARMPSSARQSISEARWISWE